MVLSNETLEHLKSHVKYPASKVEILAACNNWSDVPEHEKKLADSLPDKTFNSAEEVIGAIRQ
ncbi:MAG TPA: hypothetical protein VJJ76_03765 [archaeon]|nr:hypothetical protein [archaeon]